MATDLATPRSGRRHVLVPPELSARGLSRGGTVVALSGQTMGTTWRLSYRDPSGHDADEIMRGVQQALNVVVAEMSTWLPQSDIRRFNAAAAGTWHSVPRGFATVLARALDVAARSNGAFDPTAGPLVDLWGFGSTGMAPRVPNATEVAAACARVGWRRVARDERCERILQPGGVALDLSSIAKGFGVDEMARSLEARAIDSYLCEIGGELRGAGCKPDGSPWWVSLEHPPEWSGHVPETIIALCGKAVATSGNYVRRFKAGGRSFGHTIDPRSGLPVDHGLVAVSVVADDCMTADALATAILVLGPEQGFAWVAREGVAACLTINDEAGVRVVFSPAMQGYF